jgi:hypothetical protein
VVCRIAGTDGLNIVVNSGSAAGQDVFHYHIHLIPRFKGDGFDIPLPFPGSAMPDRTVLDMTAARIIAALRDPLREERRGRGPRPGSAPAPNAGRPPAHRPAETTGLLSRVAHPVL